MRQLLIVQAIAGMLGAFLLVAVSVQALATATLAVHEANGIALLTCATLSGLVGAVSTSAVLIRDAMVQARGPQQAQHPGQHAPPWQG